MRVFCFSFLNAGYNQLTWDKTDLAVKLVSGLCMPQIEESHGDRGVDFAG